MNPVIGLEVHVELKTKSKMFCGCSADYFGKKPNTHTCPVCLGLPGSLPVPNKTAIEWCVMLGMTLNCDIPQFSKFDRKNYFYPDLPKGYQISQYDEPFCLKGSIKLDSGKTIGITRVHMEEDTGKLIHESVGGEDVTLIDFNRSGVPLVEIVTDPDFDNVKDVIDYLKKLQQITRYLDISNADMEKGDMRLEPNVSISTDGKIPNYKVEVKNINSFKFVEKSINYEIRRQASLIKENEKPIQETRGWNEAKQKTVSQRVKEESSDYRYFPEPDIPPIKWSQKKINEIRSFIPELADEKVKRFTKAYALSNYDGLLLTKEKSLADYFEETIKQIKLIKNDEIKPTPKQVANYIINKGTDPEQTTIYQLIHSIQSSLVLSSIPDKELKDIIKKVLKDYPKITEDYKKGKKSVIQFAIGQVMYIIRKKIDIEILRKLIIEELN